MVSAFAVVKRSNTVVEPDASWSLVVPDQAAPEVCTITLFVTTQYDKVDDGFAIV